jgi:hypothetical protein
MINLDVCRIKFPSLEGVGVGFIRKISFLESQTIPIGLIVLSLGDFLIGGSPLCLKHLDDPLGYEKLLCCLTLT